ncbi:collagen-binding domain-containing protein [Catellatospora sp. NPDC049609]|uniref:collagen-binding domain-containing protein n=1 Tax=Catellatospora sp. NPDC049609 TaxID=3155505 RepID=UPI00342CCFD6
MRKAGRGLVATSATVGTAALLASALVGATSPASAASPARPTAAALGFHVFAESSVSLYGTGIEGPVAMGGDLTLEGPFTIASRTPGTFRVDGDAQPSALVVGDEIDFEDSAPEGVLQVLNSGYAKVEDLRGADVRNDDDDMLPTVPTRIVRAGATYESSPRVELTTQQPIASVGPVDVIDFGAAFADFRASARALARCAGNVVLRDAQGRALPADIPPGATAYLTLTPGTTNVLRLSAGQLDNIATLVYRNAPSATAPLLIDVDTADVDDVFDWTVPEQSGVSSAQAPFILWNFATAEIITQRGRSHTLVGTLFAPDASLSDDSRAANEGQLILRELFMGDADSGGGDGGEVRYFPFDAELNCGSLTPSPSASASGSTAPSPSASPSGSASPDPSASPSAGPEPRPSVSPSRSHGPRPSVSPSRSHEPRPSVSPSRSHGPRPSVSPSASPSRSPYSGPRPPRP